MITAAQFYAAVGSRPKDDDLERCNCPEAGAEAHWSCGWCDAHNKPVFICGLPCSKAPEAAMLRPPA